MKINNFMKLGVALGASFLAVSASAYDHNAKSNSNYGGEISTLTQQFDRFVEKSADNSFSVIYKKTYDSMAEVAADSSHNCSNVAAKLKAMYSDTREDTIDSLLKVNNLEGLSKNKSNFAEFPNNVDLTTLRDLTEGTTNTNMKSKIEALRAQAQVVKDCLKDSKYR